MKTSKHTKEASRPAPESPAAAGGRRDKNKEQTKDRILEVAMKLFRKNGLNGTTTRQISKEAGIAEGTLFNYFKSKEDLALYFFQKETDSLIEWYYAQKELQSAPIGEKLFAIIHRQLEYLEPCEDFIGAVFFRSLEPRSKLSPLSLDSQECRIKYLKFIKDVLATAEAEKEIPPLGDLGAYGVGVFYIGIVAHWLHDRSKGKQNTLAILDRCLHVGTRFVRKEGWEW